MKYKNTCAILGITAALSFPVAGLAAHNDDDKNLQTSSSTHRGAGALGTVFGENKLIGSSVMGSADKEVGEIQDIVVDLESGRVLYVVLDTTREFGDDHIAIPPSLFGQGQSRGDTVHLRLKGDEQKLKNAPKFTGDIDKPNQLGQASFVSQIYQHFGQSAWWQGQPAANTGSFNNVHKASDLPGMNIKNVSDQDIGEVNHVMMNLPAGRVVYVVFDPSDNFASEDNNLYALPPNALTLHSDKKTLVSNLTKDKLAGAPHFTRDNWAELSNPSFASRVYQYYGKQAYFDAGGTLAPTGRDIQNREFQDKD